MEAGSVCHPFIVVPDVITVRYKFYSSPYRLRCLSRVAHTCGILQLGLCPVLPFVVDAIHLSPFFREAPTDIMEGMFMLLVTLL